MVDNCKEIKLIKLTKGQHTIVDAEDYELLTIHKWHVSGKKYKRYVKASIHRFEKRKEMYMHRYLMWAENHEYVDHIDGNPLNNQKNNLRKCTNSQNMANQGTSKVNKTGYKGVKLFSKGKYAAQIQVNRKGIHLGYYSCPKQAAHAYDKAAKKYFGEFARLNFP